MKRPLLIIPALYAILLPVALSGCVYRAPQTLVTTVPLEDIPRIEPGITVDELADLLADKTYWRYRAAHIGDEADVYWARFERTVTHEFTVLRGEDAVLCVSSRVIQPSFCFVFVDDRLEKTCRHRDFGYRTPDPAPRVGSVLEAENLSREAFVAIINDAIEGNRRYQSALEPVP